LGHLLNFTWAAVLAVYWAITSALLADLYGKYCEDREDSIGEECNENEKRFVALPIIGFICMGAWVS